MCSDSWHIGASQRQNRMLGGQFGQCRHLRRVAREAIGHLLIDREANLIFLIQHDDVAVAKLE